MQNTWFLWFCAIHIHDLWFKERKKNKEKQTIKQVLL